MVRRSGRLPREPRTKISDESFPMNALRLRREDKQTALTVTPPQIDYQKIIIKGNEALQEGQAMGEKIIADEQKLRERVLPPEEELPQTPRRGFIESLPESVPEPPKIEQEIPKIATKIALGRVGLGTIGKAFVREASKIPKRLKKIEKFEEEYMAS